MNFYELLRVSFRSLRANKLRSFLTMLGIIIGVGAVIAMVSIGQGVNKQITSQIQSLGTNVLTVSGGQARTGGVSQGSGSTKTLKMRDAEEIAKLDSVKTVASVFQGRGQVKFESKNTSTSLYGTTESYFAIKSWKTESGRMFSAGEMESGEKVAVIGSTASSNLFGTSNPVGQLVKINNVPVRIVGLLETKGGSGFSNPDDAVFVPISTYKNRFLTGNDRNYVQTIIAEAKSADLTTQASEEIQITLRQLHKLAEGKADDFQIQNAADLLTNVQSITQMLTLFLGGVGAISLLVGGIGIMNIMLVSVTERTREIGTRKAIGAKESAILAQFLIEAVTLSVLGGAIGVLAGYAGSQGVGKLMSLATYVPFNVVAFSVLFSAAIGVLFGVFPARKAAKLDPIDALRYE